MNKGHLFWIIPLCLIIGILFATWIIFTGENKIMGKYDLFNCIYNNAEFNRFNQNPVMIKKIEDECICFREYNYTNLLEVNCSK